MNESQRVRLLDHHAVERALARMARELHWDVTILDHREALAVAQRFPAGCRVSAVEPENLSAELPTAAADIAASAEAHRGVLDAVLALDAPDEPSFRVRPAHVADVYGRPSRMAMTNSSTSSGSWSASTVGGGAVAAGAG